MTPDRNERLLRLIAKGITRLQSSIDQHTVATNEQSHANEKASNPDPQNVVVSHVDLPAAVEHHYAAQNNERPTKNRRDIYRLVLESVGLMVAGILAYQAFRTLGQIQTQTETFGAQLGVMKQQLEGADRAWVKVEFIPNTVMPPTSFVGGPLTFDQNGRGTLSRGFVLNNLGHSVATEARLRDKVIVAGSLDSAKVWLPIDEQKKLCDESNAPPKVIAGRPSPSYTIFPNGQTKVYEVSTFETSDIPEAPADFHLKWGKPINVYLVGCVDYTYGSATKPHQTGFVFEVYGGPAHKGIQVKMPSPVRDVTFEPYFLGGEYAN